MKRKEGKQGLVICQTPWKTDMNPDDMKTGDGWREIPKRERREEIVAWCKKKKRKGEKMTNRAVWGEKRGRYIARKRGTRCIYKEKLGVRAGIRFRNKRVREGEAQLRVEGKKRQIRRIFP